MDSLDAVEQYSTRRVHTECDEGTELHNEDDEERVDDAELVVPSTRCCFSLPLELSSSCSSTSCSGQSERMVVVR